MRAAVMDDGVRVAAVPKRPHVGAVIASKYRDEGVNVGEAIVLARMALDAIDAAGWTVVETPPKTRCPSCRLYVPSEEYDRHEC